jgi:hypothetical protein
MKLVRIFFERALLLGLLLAIVGKVTDQETWTKLLHVASLAIESMAFAGLLRGWHRFSSMLLMAIATVGIVMALQDRSASCRCFGSLIALDWRAHLAAAGLLGVMASMLLCLRNQAEARPAS